MKNKNIIDNKRRAILKTFAASGISKALISSSPLVAGILFSRHAEAQSGGLPNKSLALYIPGGAIHDFWAPTGSGNSMVLGPMSAGYEDVKTECNFLRNMSFPGGGHGQQPIVFGNNNYQGDSYEVAMGRALGPDMPFLYMNLGVHSNGQGTLTRQGNSQVPFQDNPFNAFNLAFGGDSGGGSGSGSNSQTSVLDAHVAGTVALRTKLAGYEIQRLEEHLDAISDTRRRLEDLSANTGGGSCPAAPDGTEFPLTFATFSQQARLQADIAVAALACGLTSSVSIGFGNHQKEFSIPELNFQGIYHQSIHGGSGGRANYPFYVEMRNHLSSLSAYIIQRLSDQGILDSTVFVEGTDMGHGDLHGSNDVPMMIAGGGSAINRGTTTAGNGFNNRDLIHTAARALGVNLGYGREIPGVLA